MAVAKQNASGGLIAVIAVVLAVPFLFSPLYVSSLSSPRDRIALKVEPIVESVLADLQQSDESLLRVGDLRQRLTAAGVEMTAEASARVAEAKPELLDAVEADLRQGGSLSTDRILSKSESVAKATVGSVGGVAAPTGLPGKGAAFAQKSFNDLAKLIKDNDAIVQGAESKIKTAAAETAGDESGANNYWVNRAAAMVALAKGRTARDRAWLDRWQAAQLRAVARQQGLQAAAIRRMSEDSGARAPTQAIEDATKLRTALQKQAGDLHEAADKLKKDVDAERTRIEALVTTARTHRDAMNQMDLKPFKAKDAMKASAELKKVQQEYEQHSVAAREAESRAESLRTGALVGGELAGDSEGDMLGGKYEGSKPGVGLVAMEARLAELEARASAVEADEVSVKDELAKLNATAQQLDAEKATLATAADEQAAAARKTMTRVVEAMKSAAQSEEAVVAAFDGGMRYTQAAQTAAKKRGQDANSIKNEAAAEKTAERLQHVISDKDTEAAALTLGANLAWAAADVYAQGIGDETSHTAFAAAQDKLLGAGEGEQPASHVDAWRKSAQDKLALASQRLAEAKNLIGTAVFEGLDNLRITGTNYKWQVSQLEAGIHLMAAALAESPEASADALAKARVALQEAVTGRENSPLLANAVETLRNIR